MPPCGRGAEGSDEIALVQIGADRQKSSFEWAEKELLPALREL